MGSEHSNFERQPKDSKWMRGTLVCVHKPATAGADSAWLDHMDKYDGVVGVVLDAHKIKGKKGHFKICVGHTVSLGLVAVHYNPLWLTRLEGPLDAPEIVVGAALEKMFNDSVAGAMQGEYYPVDVVQAFSPGEIVEHEGARAVVMAFDQQDNSLLVAFPHEFAVDSVPVESVKRADNQVATAREQATKDRVLNTALAKCNHTLAKLQAAKDTVESTMKRAQGELGITPQSE